MTEKMTGGFTLPGEAGYEDLTLQLAKRWGADVIRDSDGTELSDEIINSGYGIYSTICIIRDHNAWAKEHPQYLQQTFLMTQPLTATEDSLSIHLIKDFFEEQFRVNDSGESLKYWEVYDRTSEEKLAAAVALVHEKSGAWGVNPNRIFLEGSSAGGHLAASYGVFWRRTYVRKALGLTEEQADRLRPAGLILNYPVINSGKYAHEGSFRNLLGEAAGEEECREEQSIEKQVNADMPPVFLWHGGEDASVPPENSLLLAMACREAGVPVELHLYMKGGHGLGLANELTQAVDGYGIEPSCQSWMELAHTWMREVIA